MEEKNVGFSCLGAACPNHCCGAFSGLSGKLKKLDKLAFTEIVLLPEDVTRIREAGKAAYIVRKDPDLFTMKTEKDGTCAALHEGRCELYDVRPSLCKAYPLYLDLFAGLCYVSECPAFDPQMPVSEYRDALRHLLDVYQYWIDRYRAEL